MSMLQEFDPLHSIPRSQIVSKHVRVSEVNVVLFCIVLSGFAGFIFWGFWVDDVVPEEYVFIPGAHAPDRDYLPPSRR